MPTLVTEAICMAVNEVYFKYIIIFHLEVSSFWQKEPRFMKVCCCVVESATFSVTGYVAFG